MFHVEHSPEASEEFIQAVLAERRGGRGEMNEEAHHA